MHTILITGASGFVATHMIKRLNAQKFKRVYCLSRPESKGALPASENQTVKFIRGNLLDGRPYERELAAADIVVHLAAATGKAKREEYFKTNVEGTRILTENCRRLGVPKFLYVSSIAVQFPDKNRYYYAQSKTEAEEVVRSSGLQFTILRPTIILGRNAPAWKPLAALARLPIIPIPGDGKTLIQPIAVEDVVNFILRVIERDAFRGDTLELGGPQAISMEEFLKKIHLLWHGTHPRTVRIPLAPLLPVLVILEALFGSLMPVTVGQLSSFRFDGTTTKNWLVEEASPRLQTIDEILASLCAPDGD